MARRPLLPERATFYVSLIGGLLAWVAGTRVADAVVSGTGAIVAGIVVGLIALVGIPTLLGRPESGVMLLAVVGGLAIVVGFVSQLDDIGAGQAAAIFLPASIVLVALVWATKRFLVPSGGASNRG